MTNDKLRRFRLATAKRLRANETSAEQRLWKALDRIPLAHTHFRRQVPIGPYVADFACLGAKLIIEVDGPSHTEPGAEQRDAKRSAWLESQGYRVLRFWNADVYENIDGVLDTIYAALYGSIDADCGDAPPPPSARGGGSDG